MLRFISTICILVLLVSCCTSQDLPGCVIDSRTKKPIAGVKISKYGYDESPGTVTGNQGLFYHSSMGLFPNVKLFYYKEGYKTKAFKSRRCFVIIKLTKIGPNQDSALKLSKKEIFNQVVYGNAAFNPDSSTTITRAEFDNEVAQCVHLMQDTFFKKKMFDLPEKHHVIIMKCLNTINAQKERTAQDSLLLKLARELSYGGDDLQLFGRYKEWFFVYLNGEKFYPKLKLHYSPEGHIVPPYARYKIVN
jgi:hypothetical protein